MDQHRSFVEMTRTELRSRSRKQLDSLARRRRIRGRHGMNKEELIDALLAGRPARRKKTRKPAGRAKRAASRKPQKQKTVRRILASPRAGNGKNSAVRDRLVAESLDAQWILVRWTLTRRVLQRAQAALGLEWHQAVPVIRVFDVTAHDAATAPSEWMRDVEIQGDVDRWYIPVEHPPRTLKFQIGYRTPSGKFFALARSNRVRPPKSGANGKPGSNRREEADSLNSRANSSIRRKENGRAKTRGRSSRRGSQGRNGASGTGDPFEFRVEAELIVHGSTHPDAELTLFGERVPLQKDGTFSCRIALPEGRQVIPAVAVTPCGKEQRTIVLGVERNTKQLEPQRLDEPPL